ncbi:extracellular solute-binding protein [Reyranella aquatilis]|uniref:Extracellular solute-binding protein n=1 Tax=Reyranella aquatilis TaxID=2035356 RepID=A0ABS8KRC6_9HYPH|nr:extracellular solute-binding protein [Reyranella aquatilis]MCC8428191.1 extracellular solute-binding protein [Reyranella aquatilis]
MKRRTFVGAATALTGASFLPGFANAQSKEIRMIESGGASGESIQKGYIDPLKAKTGINVVRESPSSLGKLRALVESGQTGTTLFELGSGVVLQAKKLGLIEKLDWAAINPAPMFPEAKNEYGFGYQYFSTIMAWRKGAKEPKNFTEFFDTKAFPGKRCLPDYPHYCLPFAVQAAGVPIDKLFPLDVDLAFKKLNEIKKDVAVWWKAGAQPPQLMKDNEVQYSICWSGRVVGDPAFGLNFAGGKADLSFICVVKGSKPEDKAAANKLFYEMSLPENQAKAAEVISYTGPSPTLDALLPKDKLWQFPTSKQNKDVQYFENAEWWADNGEAVNKKWEAFKLSL